MFANICATAKPLLAERVNQAYRSSSLNTSFKSKPHKREIYKTGIVPQ
jgi:hypothetical protein